MADRNGEQLSRALWLHPDELPTLLTSILRTDSRPSDVLGEELILKRLAASPFASRRRPRRGSQVKRFLVEEGIGTDREFRAIFDRKGGAT